jgi:hypothetical protein
MVGAFAAVVAICLGVMAVSLKVGLKRMEAYEF